MKEALRREMRLRRRALTVGERRAASEEICAKLLRDHALAGTIAVYLASPQEIDLAPFIRAMLARGCRLVAPRWTGAEYELSVLKGLDGDHLRKGPMGILEPSEREIVAPGEVDAWLVPGLAFTKEGGRLGYGGGWYDRLLSASRAEAPKLGVAYSFQVVDAVPCEAHDIPLTGIVVSETCSQHARRKQ